MPQTQDFRAPLDPDVIERVRTLTHRYIRRNLKRVSEVDSLRMARRLESLVPQSSKGPATRAILQSIVDEIASSHRVPIRV